jgi:hypothetical protein
MPVTLPATHLQLDSGIREAQRRDLPVVSSRQIFVEANGDIDNHATKIPEKSRRRKIPHPPQEKVDIGVQIKLVFALFAAALSLVACKQNGNGPDYTEVPGGQSQVIIFYDRMWSIDSATDSTFGNVFADVKLEENEFYITFSTAFQSEPACSGVSLSALGQPEGNSPNGLSRLNPEAKDQWKLNVTFKPGNEKQAWSMGPMMSVVNSSGEGDVYSIAHTICSIAKGIGGQVIE